MFIQTEQTPNPETLKFIPGQDVMPSGTADFLTLEEAKKSPLAESIFTIAGIKGVFFGKDFVTVTKDNQYEWAILKPLILTKIMDHYTFGYPIILDHDIKNQNNLENNDPISKQIKELLETRVRPAVAQDGGDIVFDHFNDGIVYLHLKGSCAGCPSSTATLKMGIENMLRHYIPEVQEVKAI
ncbi:MAG: NifU family protein [Alphaproteobacteria bacterium]|nr:NifU family protein [Alphaproteobacteria bacterium]